MDASIVRETARMVMLGYGMERLPDVDGPFNLTVRDVVLWGLVRSQLPRLGFAELMAVVKADGHCFSPMKYLEGRMIERVVSQGGVRFDSKGAHLKKYLARRKDYSAALEDWQSQSRPAIPAFSETEVVLTPAAQSVVLLNEGFGGDEALEVRDMEHPDWVAVERNGLEFILRARTRVPGVYAGTLVVETAAGDAELPLRVDRLDFAEPAGEEVRIDTVLEATSAGCDPEATRDKYLDFLSSLGFEILPGNLAVRARERVEYPAVMRTQLGSEYLRQGVVPFPHRLPPEPPLFDADGTPWPDTITYQDGFLSGLGPLIEDFEVKAGQYLALRPVPNGFRFDFEEPDPLYEAKGFRYWITGSASELSSLPDIVDWLRRWLREGELNILVSHWQENDFTHRVSELHAAGVATVKITGAPLSPMLYAEGDQIVAVNLLTRHWVQSSTDVRFLWRSGELLWGEDRRGQAETSSDGLTLDLTPDQRGLAASLRPAPIPEDSTGRLLQKYGVVRHDGPLPRGVTGVQHGECWFADSESYARLIRLRTAFKDATGGRHGRVGMVRSGNLLSELGLSPQQVNLWRDGVRVTVGGWMVPDPSTLSLTSLAGMVGELLDEPVHHSQLRQIAEALVGHSIDPGGFLQASLHGCGWGGDGYRRRHLPGEPTGTNVHDVVRSLLSRRFLKRSDLIRAARRFVRTAPEKIGSVYDSVMQEYWDR